MGSEGQEARGSPIVMLAASVCRDWRLTPAAWQLLAWYGWRAESAGEVGWLIEARWCGSARIASETGLPRRTLIQARVKLVEYGYITLQRLPKGAAVLIARQPPIPPARPADGRDRGGDGKFATGATHGTGATGGTGAIHGTTTGATDGTSTGAIYGTTIPPHITSPDTTPEIPPLPPSGGRGNGASPPEPRPRYRLTLDQIREVAVECGFPDWCDAIELAFRQSSSFELRDRLFSLRLADVYWAFHALAKRREEGKLRYISLRPKARVEALLCILSERTTAGRARADALDEAITQRTRRP